MNQQVSFDDEPLILVDSKGTPVGSKPKLECHLGDGLLHRAFSVFLFNSNNEVLLQKRSKDKFLWGGYWSNSCCSHPRLGEEDDFAAKRRMLEELGVEVTDLRKHFDFEYTASFQDIGCEHEFCAVYTCRSDQEIRVNENEIAEIRWVKIDELAAVLEAEDEHFTPWIKIEWKRLHPLLVA